MVTKGDGEIVTLPDAHPEGVSNPVVESGLKVTVKLPQEDGVEEVLGVIVKLPDGDPEGVIYCVLGMGDSVCVTLTVTDPVGVS